MKLSGGDESADNCRSARFEYFHDIPTVHIDRFTEKDKEAFKDRDYYLAFRREIEREMNVSYWI